MNLRDINFAKLENPSNFADEFINQPDAEDEMVIRDDIHDLLYNPTRVEGILYIFFKKSSLSPKKFNHPH